MKKVLSLMLAMLITLSSVVLMATTSVFADSSDSVSLTLDAGLILKVNDTEYELAAKEMTVEKGGYSVKDYAEALYAAADTSSQTKVLLKALLEYGAAAQEYFNYEASDLANANLGRTTSTPNISSAYTPTVTQGTSVTSANATLSLDSTILIIVEFVSEDGLTFTVDSSGTDAAKSDNTYTVSIPVYPQNIDKMYTVKASDGTEIQYSVLSYIKNKYAGASDDLKALLGAIYDYNQAADAYVGNYVATVTASDGTVTGYTNWANTVITGAAADSTVTLYSDVAANGAIAVMNALSLDLNGNTLTLADNLTADGAAFTVKDSAGANAGVIDGANATVTTANGGAVVFTEGYVKTKLSGNLTVNGGKFDNDPSAYLGDEYVAGPVYTTDKKTYVNNSDKVAYYEISNATKAFNFNDSTGLNEWNKAGSAAWSIENGALKLEIPNSSSRWIKTNESYQASNCGFRFVEIRLSNTVASGVAQTHVLAVGGITWADYDCGTVSYTAANDYVIITVDLTASSYYTNTPDGSFNLRFDALNAEGTAYIDYIKLYDGVVYDETLEEPVKDIVFNFNTDGNNEGWTANKCFGTAKVENGAYYLVCDTESVANRYDAQMSLNGASIKATDYTKCQVTYKYDFGTETNYQAELFCKKPDGNYWSISTKAETAVSDEYVTITFDLSDWQTWEGFNVTWLRLDMCECPGTMYIDSIVFTN